MDGLGGRRSRCPRRAGPVGGRGAFGPGLPTPRSPCPGRRGHPRKGSAPRVGGLRRDPADFRPGSAGRRRSVRQGSGGPPCVPRSVRARRPHTGGAAYQHAARDGTTRIGEPVRLLQDLLAAQQDHGGGEWFRGGRFAQGSFDRVNGITGVSCPYRCRHRPAGPARGRRRPPGGCSPCWWRRADVGRGRPGTVRGRRAECPGRSPGVRTARVPAKEFGQDITCTGVDAQGLAGSTAEVEGGHLDTDEGVAFGVVGGDGAIWSATLSWSPRARAASNPSSATRRSSSFREGTSRSWRTGPTMSTRTGPRHGLSARMRSSARVSSSFRDAASAAPRTSERKRGRSDRSSVRSIRCPSPQPGSAVCRSGRRGSRGRGPHGPGGRFARRVKRGGPDAFDQVRRGDGVSGVEQQGAWHGATLVSAQAHGDTVHLDTELSRRSHPEPADGVSVRGPAGSRGRSTATFGRVAR